MAEVTEIARARAAKLQANYNWPDPAVLEDILALGDDVVPALDELLTPERLAVLKTDEEADTLVYYVLELLAALKTPAAISAFVRAYPSVSDDTVEGLEHALQSLGPQAVDSLIALAANPALSWYARALAINGAVHEASRDPAVRLRVTASLRAILASYVERPEPLTLDEKEIVSTVISDLAEMADPEARPLIDAAFAAGQVLTAEEDETGIAIVDLDSVEQLYAEGGRIRTWNPPLYLEDYRKRWQEHQEGQRKLARMKLLEPDPDTQPVVLGRKLGRNDPCWCGSGKKYKKCHLTQDEKEKVRL